MFSIGCILSVMPLYLRWIKHVLLSLLLRKPRQPLLPSSPALIMRWETGVSRQGCSLIYDVVMLGRRLDSVLVKRVTFPLELLFFLLWLLFSFVARMFLLGDRGLEDEVFFPWGSWEFIGGDDCVILQRRIIWGGKTVKNKSTKMNDWREKIQVLVWC